MRYVSQARRLSKLENEFEAREKRKSHIDIIRNENELFFTQSKLKYIPSYTINKFHNADDKIKIMMGAFGSGKTVGVIAEIIFKAIEMPRCKDDIRRCKILVIRNTYNDLKRTCIKSWNDWTSTLGSVYSYLQSPLLHRHTFNDGKGIIELELHFFSIDTEKQLRQLKSFEASYVWLCELSELDEEVLHLVLGRVGRYPMSEFLEEGKTYNAGILADTNAPNKRHWLVRLEKLARLIEDDRCTIYQRNYKYIIDNKEFVTSTKIFHQPPALLLNEKKQYISNPYAENITHLEGGYQYYFNMIPSGEEFVRVYVQGKYGSIQSGLAVFQKYNDDIHSVENIDIVENVQIIYGVDYGTIAPAILVCQWVAGQLRCIKEFVGDHIYIGDMAKETFIPWLDKNEFKNADTKKTSNSYGKDDCAQTDDGRKQLRDLGLNVTAARTNKPEIRLAAVNDLLGRISSTGTPAFLVSRSGCPILREGLLGQYIFERTRIRGETTDKDTPSKTHPISDIQDALQYIALEFARIDYKETKVVQSHSTIQQNPWL